VDDSQCEHHKIEGKNPEKKKKEKEKTCTPFIFPWQA